MTIDLSAILKEVRTPRNHAVWQEIVQFLPPQAKTYLVGGYIRDAALSSSGKRLVDHADLDFLVVGLDECNLSLLYKGPIDRKTTFGGIEATVFNQTVDLWTAELQVKVAGGKTGDLVTLERALDHFTLTTNAVAYDFEQDCLTERGFLLSFQKQEIDLGHYSNWIEPWIPYHLAHLARAKVRTGFSLSSRIIMQLQKIMSPVISNKAIDYLRTRKKDKLAIDFLQRILNSQYQ